MAIHIDPSVDNYCVMGCPVTHSKSPQIHTAFAQQIQQNIFYQRMQINDKKFKMAVKEFQAEGGKGINITTPFKGDAWEVADNKSIRAERALAVNTISFDQTGSIIGDNTDGVGLVRDLTINHDILIKGKNILILGAGGAVRGILDPLFDQEVGKVIIANRTVSRAKDLARIFSDRGNITACGFDQLVEKKFDLLINGTSASLKGEVPALSKDLCNANTYYCDMAYAKGDTPFVSWVKAHGATKTADGVGMLVEQAAESFFIWRGIRPSTIDVIQSLRQSLNE